MFRMIFGGTAKKGNKRFFQMIFGETAKKGDKRLFRIIFGETAKKGDKRLFRIIFGETAKKGDKKRDKKEVMKEAGILHSRGFGKRRTEWRPSLRDYRNK